VIVVSDSNSFADILLKLYLFLLPLLIEYLLNIEALRLSPPLLELHILTHLSRSTLLIFILRVLLFRIFKLLNENLRIDFCKSRVRENWAALLFWGLEVSLPQGVVEMAIAWHWREDVRGLFWATTAAACGDGSDGVAIRANMLVFQVSV